MYWWWYYELDASLFRPSKNASHSPNKWIFCCLNAFGHQICLFTACVRKRNNPGKLPWPNEVLNKAHSIIVFSSKREKQNKKKTKRKTTIYFNVYLNVLHRETIWVRNNWYCVCVWKIGEKDTAQHNMIIDLLITARIKGIKIGIVRLQQKKEE